MKAKQLEMIKKILDIIDGTPYLISCDVTRRDLVWLIHTMKDLIKEIERLQKNTEIITKTILDGDTMVKCNYLEINGVIEKRR